MPLPLVPVAIVLGLSALGGLVSGGRGAQQALSAKAINKESSLRHESALSDHKAAFSSAEGKVIAYGNFQASVLSATLVAWLTWLEANERKVRMLDHASVEGIYVHEIDLPTLRSNVEAARGIISGGVTALGAGFAAQQLALNGVGIFATASTGTGIAALTGAAQESAVMAWLGGGSLAAGGGGVAVGASMITGLAIAPALLVGGLVLGREGEKSLTRAHAFAAEVDVACAEIAVQISLLELIDQRIKELTEVLNRLDQHAQTCMVTLTALDFSPEHHATEFQAAAIAMKAVSEVLDAPLLNNEHEPSQQSLHIVERYAS